MGMGGEGEGKERGKKGNDRNRGGSVRWVGRL
jgi:hypothetical protein